MDNATAKRQKAYRERKALRVNRLELGHRQILEKLEGNTKPLAATIRQISEDALA
jgi:hypothetical protein